MKNMYFKLIGLLSLTFSMEKINEYNCNKYYSSDTESEDGEGNGYIFIKTIPKVETKINSIKKEHMGEEVESLLNFFELMDISLNLDFYNYKEY